MQRGDTAERQAADVQAAQARQGQRARERRPRRGAAAAGEDVPTEVMHGRRELQHLLSFFFLLAKCLISWLRFPEIRTALHAKPFLPVGWPSTRQRKMILRVSREGAFGFQTRE